MKTNRASGKRHFTLVELLVGIVLSSILLLAGAALLFFMASGRTQVSTQVRLQRDAQAVMAYMHKVLREAGANEVSVVGDRLEVVRDGGATEAFYAVDTDLIHDPDTEVVGDESVLVQDDLALLEFTQNTDPDYVAIRLVLSSGDFQTEMESVVAQRN
jgi:Tfp pilus assembly protein PilW